MLKLINFLSLITTIFHCISSAVGYRLKREAIMLKLFKKLFKKDTNNGVHWLINTPYINY